MADISSIEHEGIVMSADPARREAKVRIDRDTAGCEGCAAAFMCGAGKGEEITVECHEEMPAPGSRVSLTASRRTHRLAVLLLLVLPCLALVLVTLVCMECTPASPGVSALAGLGAMGLAFFLVYLLSPRSTRRLSFRLNDSLRPRD